MIMSFISTLAIPFYKYGDRDMFLITLVFAGGGLATMLFLLMSNDSKIYINGKLVHSAISNKLFALIFGLFFGGIPWYAFAYPVLSVEPIYLIAYIIGILAIFIMCIFLKILPKRTKYGNKILGEIKGFKTFLETAEKTRLESMVAQNPNYFYDILPYAYVLGVSDKWIKNFETITPQAPTWYIGIAPFSVATFGHAMDSTFSSANEAMSSNPSNSSSGGGGSW